MSSRGETTIAERHVCVCVCVCTSIILPSARWPEESPTLTTTTVEIVGFPSTQLNFNQMLRRATCEGEGK